MAENEASQLLMRDGWVCKGKGLSSRKCGVRGSERGGCTCAELQLGQPWISLEIAAPVLI